MEIELKIINLLLSVWTKDEIRNSPWTIQFALAANLMFRRIYNSPLVWTLLKRSCLRFLKSSETLKEFSRGFFSPFSNFVDQVREAYSLHLYDLNLTMMSFNSVSRENHKNLLSRPCYGYGFLKMAEGYHKLCFWIFWIL